MERGTKILNGGLAVDDRGTVSFVNDFDFSGVKRFYQVENHRQGFIRAWHGHKHEGKYIYVARGSALIGAVELPDYYVDEQTGMNVSRSNEQPDRYVLSANKPQVLFIPPGYCNGAMNLEQDTIVLYFSTSTLDQSLHDDVRFTHDTWNIWSVDNR